MDLSRVLKRSRKFYREHGLASWLEAIPREPPPIREDDPTLLYANKCDFWLGWAFPPLALQLQTLDLLVEETARKPAPALADPHQYQAEPFLADTWTKTPNGRVLQRATDLGPRTEGPYFLLLSPNPITNAWGRSGQQIQELFDGRGWSSLTVPEYLVLQRYLCEKHGDHRFFDKPQDPSLTHWIWLLDSAQDGESAVAMTSVRGVNLQATRLGNRDSRRAGIASLVLPWPT